jgi:hypothetical protein
MTLVGWIFLAGYWILKDIMQLNKKSYFSQPLEYAELA